MLDLRVLFIFDRTQKWALGIRKITIIHSQNSNDYINICSHISREIAFVKRVRFLVFKLQLRFL